MGFRFRRSVKIAPGIRLNLSKGGVSTSLGGRGATVNVSKRGVRGTVGLPGTGMSYSEKLGGRTSRARTAPRGSNATGPSGTTSGKPIVWLIVVLIILAIWLN